LAVAAVAIKAVARADWAGLSRCIKKKSGKPQIDEEYVKSRGWKKKNRSLRAGFQKSFERLSTYQNLKHPLMLQENLREIMIAFVGLLVIAGASFSTRFC